MVAARFLSPVLGAVVLLSACSISPSISTANGFRIKGNRIVDPRGKTFLVKGVAAAYGPFLHQDDGGWSEFNYRQTASDFRKIHALGANTVRIFTDAHVLRQPKRLRRLADVVHLARAQSFVVELVNSYSAPRASLVWLRYLARKFRSDPYAWIQPINEPHCVPASGGIRGGEDWSLWQREHRRYISAIRKAGNTAPIVVNGVSCGTTLQQIDKAPLNDANLIYTAHIYGNEHPTFGPNQATEADKLWANQAARHAIVVDEVGNFNGTDNAKINSFAWTRGAIAYLRNWVLNRGGSGAVAFVWRWSDANTLVGNGTDLAIGELNDWGRLYAQQYLASIPTRRSLYHQRATARR